MVIDGAAPTVVLMFVSSINNIFIYIVFLTANNDFFMIINLNLCQWGARGFYLSLNLNSVTNLLFGVCYVLGGWSSLLRWQHLFF